MEINSKLKEREAASSPLNSPTTNTSNNNNNGVGNIPITTRSDPNSPYPTTFVTADTSSFKHVVQMLTGSSDRQNASFSSHNHHHHHHRHQQQSKQAFKLYERRNKSNAAFKDMIINAHRQNASFKNHKQPEILSPSLLNFPALTLSPVTPLTDLDPFDKSSPSVAGGSSSEERGFYFHPSPISTPRDSEPQLLTLFPLSSPRVSNN